MPDRPPYTPHPPIYYLLRLTSSWSNRLQNDKCKVCCAPDDVSHPEDVLDDDVEEILKRLETMESNI